MSRQAYKPKKLFTVVPPDFAVSGGADHQARCLRLRVS